MTFLKKALIATGVFALLCFPLVSSLAVNDTAAQTTGGYLSRSIADVTPLDEVESGLTSAPVARVNAAMVSAGESLPSAYRSDNFGYITAAKSQKDTNTCWAFSAIACAEADAIKNEGFSTSTDLSEWGLIYFMFHSVTDPLGLLAGDGLTLSGDIMMTSSNLFLTAQSLSNWRGVHDEAAAPLNRVMNNHGATLSDTLCYDDLLHLENAQILPNATAANRQKVKAAIHSLGAVSTGVFYNETFYNESTASYYNSDITDANHAITLIGWDDTYSRLNFSASCRPTGNGAWLVKNSWGTSFGQNGLFWISYEDVSIQSEQVTALDFAPADTYDHNYQYDGAPGFATLSHSDGQASVAAVYTAADNELLKAGTIFHYAEGATAYTLTVYKNPSATNPTSGTKAATVSGTFETAGLYTVPLSQAVELKKGDTFSLVFTLSCTGQLQTMVAVPEEMLISDGSLVSHNSAATGQGFFLNKGKWKDLYTTYGASPRIHGLTVLKSAPSTTKATTTTTTTTKATTTTAITTTTTTTTTTTAATTTAPSTSFATKTETATATDSTATAANSTAAATDSAATTTETATQSAFLWGDANGDGAVNMKDVLAVRKYIAGLSSVLFEKNADVQTDSAINMKDVLVLRKFLAGLPF